MSEARARLLKHADWLQQWSLAADSEAQAKDEQATAQAIREVLRELEQAEAEVERLRSALKWISEEYADMGAGMTANAALRGEGEK